MLVITIPGLLFEPLREGAYTVSRDVAEAIEHMEDLRLCRARLAGVCGLLDAIGWSREDPETDAEVDFGALGGTLRAVAKIMLPVLSDAGEHERHDALSEFVETELAGATRRLEFPVEVVALVRAVLLVEVSRTAGDLSTACSLELPGDWAGPLGRLDAVRGLLDELGWIAPECEQPVVIDLGVHGPLLQDIMEKDLDLQRWLEDTESAPGRERAAATAILVEWVLTRVAPRR
jgi:hypothetical protein